MSSITNKRKIPKEFIFRRLHSLMGLWFVLFLMEHLFTNSQAALFFGDGGKWFVNSVNFLRNLPYLHIIEIVLLGIPFTYHAIWGVYYMMSAKSNVHPAGGKKPSIQKGRNIAYSLQRISAWILLLGTILHVVQMRFINYPYEYRFDGKAHYYAKYSVNSGLYATADRLGVKLYDEQDILRACRSLKNGDHKMELVLSRLKELKKEMSENGTTDQYNSELQSIYHSIEEHEGKCQHILGLQSRAISKNEVMAMSEDFGSMVLLGVRDTFQSLTICMLYTVFVLAAVFHGFNGLWTFLVTWGILLSKKSQNDSVYFCYGIMFLFGFLGLMAIWGTYFLNLTG